MARVGEVVPRLLEQYGIDHVFGIPGNHTLELYRGLSDSSITHVTTRHEQGAAFMADGYARATGRPGVCFLISGPGLLNAATAIAQALADSIPMLVITAVADTASLGKRLGQLHELPDQQASAASFCRLSLHVATPDDLTAHLQTAFDLFACSRPGPVHIQIPLDVMGMSFTGSHRIPPVAEPLSIEEDLVRRIADRLNQAQRPLCLFGGGAVTSAMRWRAIAEKLDAPTLTTVNAKGLLPAEHALAIGGSPSMADGRAALQEADVILAVGTEFSETDYDLLMSDELIIGGDVLRVDIDPHQLTRNLVPAVAVCADAGKFAEQLLPMLHKRTDQGASRTAGYRAMRLEQPHYHADFARFFDTLQAALPGLCLVGDSTRPTYYAAWQYECSQPRRYFHSVSGFGTLGYAIPAALGAAVAVDVPVVCLIGDGGAQFSLSEFATAVDLGLPVVFIIWQNQGFEEITNSLAGRGVDTSSTRISAPDFTVLGQAYGMEVANPKDLQQLAETLTLASRGSGPTLVVVEQETFIQSESGQWYG